VNIGNVARKFEPFPPFLPMSLDVSSSPHVRTAGCGNSETKSWQIRECSGSQYAWLSVTRDLVRTTSCLIPHECELRWPRHETLNSSSAKRDDWLLARWHVR
jgi:hypothetical protein